VMVWEPGAIVVLVNVATPALKVPAPSVVEPSLKVTVPVGVGPLVFATVAVKVTDAPIEMVPLLVPRVVTVELGVTT
jgi:hypothetical protein